MRAPNMAGEGWRDGWVERWIVGWMEACGYARLEVTWERGGAGSAAEKIRSGEDATEVARGLWETGRSTVEGAYGEMNREWARGAQYSEGARQSESGVGKQKKRRLLSAEEWYERYNTTGSLDDPPLLDLDDEDFDGMYDKPKVGWGVLNNVKERKFDRVVPDKAGASSAFAFMCFLVACCSPSLTLRLAQPTPSRTSPAKASSGSTPSSPTTPAAPTPRPTSAWPLNPSMARAGTSQTTTPRTKAGTSRARARTRAQGRRSTSKGQGTTLGQPTGARRRAALMWPPTLASVLRAVRRLRLRRCGETPSRLTPRRAPSRWATSAGLRAGRGKAVRAWKESLGVGAWETKGSAQAQSRASSLRSSGLRRSVWAGSPWRGSLVVAHARRPLAAVLSCCLDG